MKYTFLLQIFLLLFLTNFVFAAHYIVGYVEDAKDGTSANGRTVVLWKESVGMQDNVTDIVGATGNSWTDNYYLIDCEMLSSGCSTIGEELKLTLVDDGTGHIAKNNITVIVSGNTDWANNLTINSPATLEYMNVDDSFSTPEKEIDLLAGETTTVTCTAILKDYDGKEEISIKNTSFYNITSTFTSIDQNRGHYTNNSCTQNNSYGDPTQTEIICTYDIYYYASPGEWICNMSIEENNGSIQYFANNTSINELLSINIDQELNYSSLTQGDFSEEEELNVMNYGNVKINLSLTGYGTTPGDGNAYTCQMGENISIANQKYNLTNSNIGPITPIEAETLYKNLTNETKINNFELNYRLNDLVNDAIKQTYWRVYVPSGIEGACTGNIVFGAIVAPEN